MITYDSPDINRIMIERVHSRRDKTPYFRLVPNVCETGKVQHFRVESRYAYMKLQGRFLVMISPYYEFDSTAFDWHTDDILEVEAEAGVLRFYYSFREEQLYRVVVAEKTDTVPSALGRFSIYALGEDMFPLAPMIGELHCHTIFSDGFESVELILDTAVSRGLDFIAITDHNDFRSAAEARRLVEEKKLPLTLIRGVEYSSSFTGMHIISLGAPGMVPSEFYSPEKPEGGPTPGTEEYIRRLSSAIRAAGGVSVMCHPMWKPLVYYIKRMDVPYTLVKDLLSEDIFDAVEIVSGSPDGDLMTSLEQYQIAVAAGAAPERIAYLGGTDSHNYSTDPIAGKHFTMVFAHENSERGILEAVRSRRTVAVQLVDDKNAFCFGPLRLVRYARFLLKEKYGFLS